MVKKLAHIGVLATLKSARKKDGRHLVPGDLDLLKDASVVYSDREILWVGSERAVPQDFSSAETIDCSGLVVTPEIIDCHTHLIFGGNRAREYGMRLNGADYLEIAATGGGIRSTVRDTLASSRENLKARAIERIESIHALGVGTIEIKTGYGLSGEKEWELIGLIHGLKRDYGDWPKIKSTLLAHAVPAEYPTSRAYLESVILPLLERASKERIIDAVDIFHEKGYFTRADAIYLYEKAKEFGIPFKCHADEFVDGKGALTACEYGALSADHLLNTRKDGIEALASSPTVAVLLPGTGFSLGKKQANARQFLDAGARVAIASDYNPGSCPIDSVLTCAALAAPLYKMNMTELWAALTLNPAWALGLGSQGAISPGLKPRFSFFRVSTLEEITYNWTKNFATWPKGYQTSLPSLR